LIGKNGTFLEKRVLIVTKAFAFAMKAPSPETLVYKGFSGFGAAQDLNTAQDAKA